MLNWITPRTALLLQATAEKFVWSEHKVKVITTALLSMVPFFEGRYAVSVALGMGMPPIFAYFLALIFSTLPMPFILLLLRPVLDWFYTLPIKPVRKFAAWLEHRSERKLQEMNSKRNTGVRGRLRGRVSEEMLELIGLYVFVAIPLPGTGIWSGSAVATLFKMPRVKAGIAILLGNMTACAIMTAATRGVISIF